MRHIILVCFAFLLSCKEEKNKDSGVSVQELTEASKLSDTILGLDTIRFSKGNYILAKLLSKSYDKDSICNANFELEFNFLNEPKTQAQLQIKGYDEGSEWWSNPLIIGL